MWVVFSYNLNLKLDLKMVELIWYWNYFYLKIINIYFFNDKLKDLLSIN